MNKDSYHFSFVTGLQRYKVLISSKDADIVTQLEHHLFYL